MKHEKKNHMQFYGVTETCNKKSVCERALRVLRLKKGWKKAQFLWYFFMQFLEPQPEMYSERRV